MVLRETYKHQSQKADVNWIRCSYMQKVYDIDFLDTEGNCIMVMGKITSEWIRYEITPRITNA